MGLMFLDEGNYSKPRASFQGWHLCDVSKPGNTSAVEIDFSCGTLIDSSRMPSDDFLRLVMSRFFIAMGGRGEDSENYHGTGTDCLGGNSRAARFERLPSAV